MNKGNAGRPTKMTKETVNKLEESFAWGCTDEEACLFANIHKATLYNYQHKNPEFIDRKEQLKQRPILKARETVVKALEKNPELALKFLERKKRDEFSTKQIVGAEVMTIEDILRQVHEKRLARREAERATTPLLED